MYHLYLIDFYYFHLIEIYHFHLVEIYPFHLVEIYPFHLVEIYDHPYSGLDKIQTLILMMIHTLDFDDRPYPRFG